jgi:23S rRNA (pseudouridine1915-N3)-methyltransferase
MIEMNHFMGSKLLLLFCVALWAGTDVAAFTSTKFWSSPSSSSSLSLERRPDKSRVSLYMGMKINIRIVGRKSSERWLEEGCEMYETRLRPSNVEVETTWHKDNPALIKGVEGDRSKGHSIVLLDPLGATKTSERFTEDMYECLDRGGSRLSFVIGGAEGLPLDLKYPSQGSKPTLISLSALTFTHQFARMLLIEQIYRATEIRKGSGYHK